RKSFAAIVAGEDDDRILSKAVSVQGFDNSADLNVQILNHPLISFLRAAVEIGEWTATRPQSLRFCLVTRRFPRPVRRVEMQTEQERPPGLRAPIDYVDGPAAEQVRQVARLMEFYIVVPEIVADPVGVRIVIESAPAKTEEVIVTA